MDEQTKKAAARETETAAAPQAADEQSPAKTELQTRTEAFLKEGYRKDVAAERAAESMAIDVMIAQKTAAGLTREQARSVAEQQIMEDRAARAAKK
jgi:hypothetical protein